MAIISIPNVVSKGVSFNVTLDMSELLAEVNDAYFQVQANLKSVLVTYASSSSASPENEQKKILAFNATIENPACPVIFSSTSRDTFVLKKIKLVDKDGGIFDIPLRDINTAGFNISFIQPPSALSYTPSTVFAIIGMSIEEMTPTVSGVVTSYSISPELPSGLSINSSTGVISGSSYVVTPMQSYTVTASNSSLGASTQASITIDISMGMGGPGGPGGPGFP
jgi:hypothetical protein